MPPPDRPAPLAKAGHTLFLDAGTVEMLANHRERQDEIKRLLGVGYHDDGWNLLPPRRSPAQPRAVSREFLRKQETYNKTHPDELLSRLKLHGLRHTWATLAIHEGIDVHVVSDRLDHSSTQIYTRVTRPMQSTPPTAWRPGSSGAARAPHTDGCDGG